MQVLQNRHLLISGKSGQGKTYFMQCLLLEKSKLGIPSIVIDYTEGFLPNQLEPEFVNYLGDKLKQKIVYSDKLPINPFQKIHEILEVYNYLNPIQMWQNGLKCVCCSLQNFRYSTTKCDL